MSCKNKELPQNKELSWTQCQWTRLNDGSSCQFRHMQVRRTNEWEIHQDCNGSLDLQFFGSQNFNTAKGNNICGVIFKSIFLIDQGLWSCSLTYHDEAQNQSCIAKTKLLARVGKTVDHNEYRYFY